MDLQYQIITEIDTTTAGSVNLNKITFGSETSESNNPDSGLWKPKGSDGECGLQTFEPKTSRRISRLGNTSELGQFPFMAALGYDNITNDNGDTIVFYNCGGTLINKWYVLTAAHCMYNLNTGDKLHPT